MANRAKKLRIVGIIVLILGITGASVVYWLGTRATDISDNLSMTAFNKPQRQEMEKLYGKWGDLSDDLADDLKQPGTQAVIIVMAAGLFAWSCFFVAGRSDSDGELPK